MTADKAGTPAASGPRLPGRRGPPCSAWGHRPLHPASCRLGPASHARAAPRGERFGGSAGLRPRHRSTTRRAMPWSPPPDDRWSGSASSSAGRPSAKGTIGRRPPGNPPRRAR